MNIETASPVDRAAALARCAMAGSDQCCALYAIICRSPVAHSTSVALILCSLNGCDGAPSRNILGSYFPSWMVCALMGIALALIARALFRASGLLEELPVPFVVMLAIACAGTFGSWLIWLS